MKRRSISRTRIPRPQGSIVESDALTPEAGLDAIEPPPADIEHPSEHRVGPIESAAPRTDPAEGIAGFLEPEEAPGGDEPLLQPERGA
ncbi:MAG: hypothetical protein QFE16_08045 [Pseudomonadota bacterium]|nr:hypothetical protein [Pseudomonadota bacterium]